MSTKNVLQVMEEIGEMEQDVKCCGRSGPNHPKSRCASGTVMPSTRKRHIGRPQDSLLTKSETAKLEAGEQSLPRTTKFIA